MTTPELEITIEEVRECCNQARAAIQEVSNEFRERYGLEDLLLQIRDN